MTLLPGPDAIRGVLRDFPDPGVDGAVVPFSV